MKPRPLHPDATCCAALLVFLAGAPQTVRGQTPAPAAPASEGATGPPTEPWRIASAVHSPAWLRLSATQRTRYERLQGQFRAGAPADARALSLRTTLLGQLRLQPVDIGAEFEDSRLYLGNDDAPVNTTLVNPLDLLQAYVEVTASDLLVEGATGRLRAGRMTVDVGSRRLVARNSFRNTINAFTGFDLLWSAPGADTVRLLVTVPVQRRPTTAERLRDNASELDREMTRALFWGVFYGSRPWLGALRGEAYLYGLRERDARDAPSQNRRLLTPGLRVLRAPTRAGVDLEVEASLQSGSSRASASPQDGRRLDHFAFFTHAAVGYTLDLGWTPRWVAQYDYASGDADPDDTDNGRFDTLFGARRFEFGPTGIYSALARSNISTPGLRLEARPRRSVDALVAYRAVWLAQARDAWTASGVQDPSGSSGTFVGHQLEACIRWQVLPDNTTLEAGLAHLWQGELATSAPNGNGNGDPFYVYAQLTLEV